MPEQQSTPDKGTQPPGNDPIGRFFVRPFFLSLTIGIPFCIFKLLFGMRVASENPAGIPFFSVMGWLIVTWALADLLMNTGRSLLDLSHRQAGFEYCTIAQLGRIFGRPSVFLAIDTLVSFSIICAMLWTGWITQMNPVESVLWYAATTMNLISLSLVSLYHEIRHADT
jgi:hypothetical protein